MRFRHLAVLAALALAPGLQSEGAPVSDTITVRVTAVDAGVTSVAVGDRFTISLTFENATLDTNAAVGAGTFHSLLTAFTVARNPANVGAWAPSGTFDLGAASNYVTNAFGNGVTFQVRGTGFPAGGAGLAFKDFDLGYGFPDIVDSGLGDTFAYQLNGTPFTAANYTFFGQLRFDDGAGNFPAATLVIDAAQPAEPIPAATHAALAVMSLLLAATAALALRRSAT